MSSFCLVLFRQYSEPVGDRPASHRLPFFSHVLDYSGKPNRKMCSMYLSMLDKLGIRLESFGDSSQRLTEIWSSQPPHVDSVASGC